MKVAILYSKYEESGRKWAIACQKKGIDYTLIDISVHDWLQKVLESKAQLLLLRPPGDTEQNKTMFDERVWILNRLHGLKLFPNMDELLIYENKKLLSYFLESNKIPHPKTKVFYNKNETIRFVKGQKLPIVMKSSIGASGSGVVICKTESDALRYINKAFSKKGIPIQVGPNRVTGNIWKWAKKATSNPDFAKKRVAQYKEVSDGRTKNMVICQEYIPHDFEWRAAKIGDSYFAHKKSKYQDKCSGTKGIDYVDPPDSLLDFVKELCENNNLNSVAIDMFEHEGQYMVNEIQCIFGHVQEHILEVDGKPGRYRFKNEDWVFEEGVFNANESYDLRLETALELYKINKL